MKKIAFILLSMFSFFVFAQSENIDALCPVKSFIGINSPSEFSERFSGDTIFFSVPNTENALFESFRLLIPDTIWIKDRPVNKLPQELKHFKLITNYAPLPAGELTHIDSILLVLL